MKKIKILFFIPQLVGGGAERVSMNIMKLLDKKVFDIHLVIVNMDHSVYDTLPDNITLHNLNMSRTLFSFVKLRYLIKKLKPDIIYSSLIRGHIAVDIAVLGLFEKPLLVFRSPNSPKLLIENKQISSLQIKLLNHAYNKADLIIAQTPEMQEEIISIHNVSRNKVEVLLNPIDIPLIDKSIENISNPFENGKINVVAAGRLVYQKGFDVLIKSFRLVIDQNPKYRLYIIGQDGLGELKNLEILVKKLSLNQYVTFLGYQKNPYKYFYYSDLYVLSSRWEGLPNTVLENLYLHKPVVATKCIPFMSSLISEGENGFLVDVEDSLMLGKSMLNYKQLSYKFKDINDSNKNINDLFINLARRVK